MHTDSWEFWFVLLGIVSGIAAPFIPKPHTARWRKFRILGWYLLVACVTGWVGLLFLISTSSGWVMYPTLAGVIAISSVLLFAGYVCGQERTLYREKDRPAQGPVQGGL